MAFGVHSSRRPGQGHDSGRSAGTGRKIALITLLLVGVATLGGVASFESLTGTATNGSASPYNSFSTGSVSLTDNQSSSAMFDVTNANPPASGSACIAVQYTGSLTSDVYLYDTVESDTNTLGTSIILTVQNGTDTASYSTGSNGDPTCATFHANTNTVAATNTIAGDTVNATAIDSWPTSTSTGFLLADSGSAAGTAAWTNPTTVWYQFTYDILGSAPAGSTTQIELTWESVGQ